MTLSIEFQRRLVVQKIIDEALAECRQRGEEGQWDAEVQLRLEALRHESTGSVRVAAWITGRLALARLHAEDAGSDKTAASRPHRPVHPVRPPHGRGVAHEGGWLAVDRGGVPVSSL